MIWSDRAMQWLGTASSKRGRTPSLSDAKIQLCLTIKGLLGMALRHALEMLESDFTFGKLSK